MKKLISLLMLSVLLTGCKTTYLVISKESLDREIENIEIDLKERGYNHANLVQSGDEYRFIYKSDSNNLFVDYTLYYTLDIEEYSGLYYITDLEVRDCSSSDPKVCSSNSQIRELERMLPDTSIQVYSPEKTRLLFGVGGGCLALIILLILI